METGTSDFQLQSSLLFKINIHQTLAEMSRQFPLKLIEDLPLSETGVFHTWLKSGEIWEWCLKLDDYASGLLCP